MVSINIGVHQDKKSERTNVLQKIWGMNAYIFMSITNIAKTINTEMRFSDNLKNIWAINVSKVLKSDFNRNVMVLVSGSVIAQVINLGFSLDVVFFGNFLFSLYIIAFSEFNLAPFHIFLPIVIFWIAIFIKLKFTKYFWKLNIS